MKVCNLVTIQLDLQRIPSNLIEFKLAMHPFKRPYSIPELGNGGNFRHNVMLYVLTA